MTDPTSEQIDALKEAVCAEVDRLVGLGARLVEDWPYPQDEEYDYVVLEDPDGNRFCVIDASGD